MLRIFPPGFVLVRGSRARVYPTEQRAWARVNPKICSGTAAINPIAAPLAMLGIFRPAFMLVLVKNEKRTTAPATWATIPVNSSKNLKLDRGDGRAGATTPSFAGSRDSPGCSSGEPGPRALVAGGTHGGG